MKKFFFAITILCIFTGSFSVFANTTIAPPVVVDVRSLSLGGFHYCDYDTPYVLLTNPAGMAAAEKKVLLPSLTMDFGGPVSVIPTLATTFIESGDVMQTLLDELFSTMSMSNGVYIDLDMSLPLTFARINNNSGFGLFNRVYMQSNIPSISKTDLLAGGEIQFAFGSSVPVINTKHQLLSLGVTSKVFARLEAGGTGNPSSIMNMDFAAMDTKGTAAIGVDVGIFYRLFNFLSVSAVWHDANAGIIGDLGQIDDISFTPEKNKYRFALNKGTLGLGVSVSIPTWLSLGLLSSWTVYADVKDVMAFIHPSEDIVTASPFLSLSAGMEMVVFNTISLRVGLNGPYLAAGAGIDLSAFHMEFAIFGQELGIDAGSIPQLHGAFGITFRY